MKQCKEIEALQQAQLKRDIPPFRVGDTLDIHTRIIEGEKERVQIFSGTVIARRGSGLAETVALYRVSYGTGMERVFSLHSPRIAKIEVARTGKVRRGKLYYLRGTSGKKSKVREQLGGAIAGAIAGEETAQQDQSASEPAT